MCSSNPKGVCNTNDINTGNTNLPIPLVQSFCPVNAVYEID